MTAFDQAWALLKMPYHGTNLERAKKIMREGLKPMAHDVVFSSDDYGDALEYAASRSGIEPGDHNTPAVIHIAEDTPNEVELFDKPYRTYDKAIDPKHLSMYWQQDPKDFKRDGEFMMDYLRRRDELMDREEERWRSMEDETDDRI